MARSFDVLLGFIEEIEATPQGPNLAVKIRHALDGQSYEVTASVRAIEFHGVRLQEGHRGPATVYRIHAPDLAAVILGVTLHVCPRWRLHDLPTLGQFLRREVETRQDDTAPVAEEPD